VPFRHRDGHEGFVRINVQVVREEDGEVLYFDGVGVDVSAEMASEKRRLAIDERFRWAFESSPIGMALATDDLEIVRANRAFEKFLGYGPGNSTGSAWRTY
jgi:PAS domain-containing protein